MLPEIWLVFVAGTSEDYKLLEQMNRTTITKYTEMRQIASNINRAIRDLNSRCKFVFISVIMQWEN